MGTKTESSWVRKKNRKEGKGGGEINVLEETREEQAEEIAQQHVAPPDSWSAWHHAVLWMTA